jgi:hypothetical protein
VLYGSLPPFQNRRGDSEEKKKGGCEIKKEKNPSSLSDEEKRREGTDSFSSP